VLVEGIRGVDRSEENHCTPYLPNLVFERPAAPLAPRPTPELRSRCHRSVRQTPESNTAIRREGGRNVRICPVRRPDQPKVGRSFHMCSPQTSGQLIASFQPRMAQDLRRADRGSRSGLLWIPATRPAGRSRCCAPTYKGHPNVSRSPGVSHFRKARVRRPQRLPARMLLASLRTSARGAQR